MFMSLRNTSLSKSIRAFHSDEEGNEMINTVAIVAISILILGFVYRSVWGQVPNASSEGSGISKWIMTLVTGITSWLLPA